MGFGYWGPNLVRNFASSPGSRVVAICDAREECIEKAARLYPNALTTTSFGDLLENPEIDLIALATPVSTHFPLGMAALNAGKHLLVEKPLAGSAFHARLLTDRAKEKGLKLFVDHTFVFTPAVQRMKAVVDQQQLGSLLYYDSTRINLGLFQHDVDVVWDLIPHDLSILDVLLNGRLPKSVSCWGINHFSDFADLAYVTLTYPDNFIAHVHVNWLAPVKIRQVLLCGDQKMIVYDDTTIQEKLRIYDRGITVREREDVYKRLVEYREGDMIAPKLDNIEALAAEVEDITSALLFDRPPLVDGELGYRVTLLLEAISVSLHSQGRPVDVEDFSRTVGQNASAAKSLIS